LIRLCKGRIIILLRLTVKVAGDGFMSRSYPGFQLAWIRWLDHFGIFCS